MIAAKSIGTNSHGLFGRTWLLHFCAIIARAAREELTPSTGSMLQRRLDFSDDLAQPILIRPVRGGSVETALTSSLQEKPRAFGR
jgi:hypothetical protein